MNHDQMIDLQTLRYIRDGFVPREVPSQRVNGIVRRGLARRSPTGRVSLTERGKRHLATLAELARDLGA